MSDTKAPPKTPTQVREEIIGHYTALSQHHAQVLSAISQLCERDIQREYACKSIPVWLIRYCRMKKSRAYEYTAVAVKLRRFAYLCEAFHQGKIDYSTVRLLLKHIHSENEQRLVDLAIELGYHGLEEALAGQQDNNTDPTPPAKGLHLREDGQHTRGWFTMSAVDGAQFKAALKAGALAYHAGLNSMSDYVDEKGEFDETKLTTALEEATTRPDTSGADILNTGFGLPPQRFLLHALMGMVQLVRSGMAKSTRLAPAAQVNIMMSMSGNGYLPNNKAVPAFNLANVAANAEARGVLFDDHGLIINYGRKRRLVSKTQMEALMSMWGHQCAMPGCNHDMFMQAHHIDEWVNGGHTDLDNLIPLCSSCHSMVTDREILIMRHGTEIHFIAPDGARWVSKDRQTPKRDDNARLQCELEDYGDNFADKPCDDNECENCTCTTEENPD
ncbi:HNH endonuclease [Corynebacterium imitans]|uniref:HNH endonuclease signature motif containing protein n=1 Tax=Corynebacterium imitans TaxID=156978 RepID=UPI001EF343AE|nr:HNH endonuclease signature motif containing protein [Corynebacterium imitans]MCG7277499.1 HNH endonuclease [Corynebacterium imitans]